MGSISNSWNGKLNVPDALLRGHDEARAVFVRATMEGGRIATAARRVAQLCLSHFEHEENGVFPVLALLPDLRQGDVRPEMMEVMPLITAFKSKHAAVDSHHHLIMSAIEVFVQAARKEKNREFVRLAHHLSAHERIEDEVIFPTVVLIGKYLQEKLAR
jgi:hemerythrin superfamily protein